MARFFYCFLCPRTLSKSRVTKIKMHGLTAYLQFTISQCAGTGKEVDAKAKIIEKIANVWYDKIDKIREEDKFGQFYHGIVLAIE